MTQNQEEPAFEHVFPSDIDFLPAPLREKTFIACACDFRAKTFNSLTPLSLVTSWFHVTCRHCAEIRLSIPFSTHSFELIPWISYRDVKAKAASTYILWMCILKCMCQQYDLDEVS